MQKVYNRLYNILLFGDKNNMKHKTGIIYKVVSPSGKVYIGQTIQPLNKRISSHFYVAFNKKLKAYNTKISKAIRKYKTSLKWTTLHKQVKIHNLDKWEKLEIKLHNSYVGGYNSTAGGHQTIYRSTNSQSGTKHHAYGKSISQETRDKISKANKGRTCSKQTRNKISKANKGKKRSAKFRKLISQSKRGKPLSIKTKKKISRNNANRKLSYKQAQEIRHKYATGNYTHRQLAKEYKVTHNTIGMILRKITHVL